MKLFLAAVLWAAFCATVSAQDFNHYHTLLPQAPVPKDFTERSSHKVATEVADIKAGRARMRKAKKKFYLESTFSIDDFLSSGSVLFNDDISRYLSNVLAEILASSPGWQSKIRVYTVKSPVANAFSTSSGIVFINLGLLARLENEAQLAFVLAHEVAHCQKQHALNAYVTSIEIDRSKGDYRKLSGDAKNFAKSTYSKELELEADGVGFDLYTRSSYERNAAYKVFDILGLADSPLNWLYFNKQVFEAGRYVFPDTLVSGKVSSLQILEDYDDSKSSHPNIKKRKQAIMGKFKEKEEGDYFRVSESQFEKIRKMARYELCRLHLLDHSYPEALMLALSLQQENPSSVYLKETVAKAIYGIARLKLEDAFDIEKDWWTGEAERIAAFVLRQTAYEASVLAIRQLYKCLEETPDNMEIRLMLGDLIQAFAEKEKGLQKKFLRGQTDTPIADLAHRYTQYAFLDFKDTGAFFEEFDRQIALAKKRQPEKRVRKKDKKKEKPLKVDKVVVVNPKYKKVDLRKKQKVRHIQSEEVLLNINSKIKNNAGKLNLKTEIINTNTLSIAQIAAMQSNSIMNDWLSEHSLSLDNQLVSPIYNEVNALAGTYKTDYFMWMGGLTLTRRNKGWVTPVLATLILPAVAPVSAAHIFIPRGNTLYFAMVFNVRTQALELMDVRQMNMKDSESLMESNIYYTFFKLKK